jgi:hypothetical protein
MPAPKSIETGNTPLKAAAEKGAGDRLFRSVKAMPGYILVVIMETGANIQFNFRNRLNTPRFEALQEESLFQSVYTDGSFLIFQIPYRTQIKISAPEFMDLVLIDRSRWDQA